MKLNLTTDTIAIIGINIAVAAILITIVISGTNRIDASNARIDTMHVMFYDLLKEVKK